MYRIVFIVVSIFILCLASACSGQVVSSPVNLAGETAVTQVKDSAQLTLNEKLGAGILSLDGTGLAITSDQAAVLLPLWQAVQSLGADKNTPSAEIAALYAQIQEALTPDQLSQIERFNWSQGELSSLIQQHQAQTSQAVSAAKSPTSASTASQGQNMGGGPGGDMLPPDGGGLMGGSAGMGSAAQNATGETQQTLILSQAAAKSTVELNVIFANAVINLLQQQLDA